MAIHYPLSFCATINFLTCKFLIKTVYHDIINYLTLVYHHFRFRGPRIPVDFVFVPRHNFPSRDCVCRVLFPPLSTRVRSISLSTPSIIRSPRFSLAKHTGSSPIPSQWSNIGRMPSIWGGRGERKETREKDETGLVERRETTKEKFPFLQGKRSDVSCSSDSEESVSRPFSNRVFPCN